MNARHSLDEPTRYEFRYDHLEPSSNGEFIRASAYRLLKQEFAAWIIKNGFATGHSDNFADLLNELEFQVAELRADKEALVVSLVMVSETNHGLLDALQEARERMLGSSPSITALRAKTDAAIAKANQS